MGDEKEQDPTSKDQDSSKDIEIREADDRGDESTFIQDPVSSAGNLKNRSDSIGPYRILARIGEGGMSVVYLAQQDKPVRRRVAIKFLKLGMDSEEIIARFDQERQALAMMNHPNVAHVIDAGATDTGRLYFVMEYVPGISITEYYDQNNLRIADRLELFFSVCHAVHHAHQKGIIHRDLKPGNILVMVQDGKPLVKVIDFGVAKVTDHRLVEKTIFTRQGQLIGTPAYMSPEQAEMSNLDVDITTDVYSLGVILYKLLVGCLPYDLNNLREAGLAEIHRIIREVEPPRPSTQVSELSDETRQIAGCRQTPLQNLLREIRGDLDWITMRAMEKDRTRRYQSASELASDIRRYLAGDAVLAGPPSASYRLRKALRRHRGLVSAVSVVLSVLLLGSIVSSLLYFRAERAKEEAVQGAYLANLRVAQLSLERGNLKEARGGLDACPAKLRGWEWDHLNLSLDTSVESFALPDSATGSFTVSPSAGLLAVVENSNQVHILDLITGETISRWDPGHKRSIGVQFSPDGSLIATNGFSESTVLIWDSFTGSLRHTLQTRFEAVTSPVFDPHTTKIAMLSMGSITFDEGTHVETIIYVLDLEVVKAGSYQTAISFRLSDSRRMDPNCWQEP